MDKNLINIYLRLRKRFPDKVIPESYILNDDVFNWLKSYANRYDTSVYELLTNRLGLRMMSEVYSTISLRDKLKLFEHNGVVDAYILRKSGFRSAIINHIRYTGDNFVSYFEKLGYKLVNLEYFKENTNWLYVVAPV